MKHANGVLELAAASSELEEASVVAERLGGTLYADEREDWQKLPFRALVTAATDDAEALRSVADVGLYLIYRRLIKPGEPGVIGLFPILRAPGMSHQAADTHWRDVHGPLALKHHEHMTHYTQLSVVETLEGPALDGIALVGFASIEDFRHRFYTGPESPAIIAEDTSRFADLKRSPNRLIAREYRFGSD